MVTILYALHVVLIYQLSSKLRFVSGQNPFYTTVTASMLWNLEPK